MSQDTWTAVDTYFNVALLPADPVFDQILSANTKAGLPAHDVAPNQGQFLSLLLQIQGARRILEIGTLGGYSTVWMARALPADGQIISLEVDPTHARVAMENIQNAGFAEQVEIRIGPALDSLAALATENDPFDFIFIDADKQNNPMYLKYALHLSRAGTIIFADNVIRGGVVVDDSSDDERIQGVRSYMDMVSNEPRLQATTIQMVGAKGYDGFTMALVVE